MDILGTSFRDETGLGGTWFSAPSATLPRVAGLDGGLPFPNRSAKGELGCEEGCLNVLSPRGIRGRGLDRPPALGDWVGLVLAACRARNRSSVAFSRASSSSSSEVCDERAFFFSDTAASRSATLLSILKRSLRASEKERAMVDCGLALGFHSLSSSSSDMLDMAEREGNRGV